MATAVPGSWQLALVMWQCALTAAERCWGPLVWGELHVAVPAGKDRFPYWVSFQGVEGHGGDRRSRG